ncbi:MAG: flagella basal body P-ring formation protein FlgA [Candidatus Raymondbacteria bacterium RifOxyA12_full_50_37]|uniref:Flagella basal body P-ring formation protein FlgA n=1 Tax=Candidatus Raymondbacteria bacterium RIFOXYD12_FULL_49_13 TaxID=1817890 RepID=A0A1F7F394_UNCRA|nr:MAG: flagella basal body P-ring formation protein FlgA [Candidatus Raymondbacteria bacterium RIFOXYA2_FULL_49_16]OGJ91101.1 MAG: flagella basal body P-ring formation protein FlgA [Candidatus Raymondbacteria bacterium RifOxyB12_full_50_8]OGJ91370.1 MAG: flagella basal body P-ring formation protein FlgA [Candidatus Raymondbacteria bacterium RifOxyA12_full_50_37]OGJ97155.1 MAG: flagella basal body P-ring formation protein FlgA [Candidatus Raymondbacteria bacterium RIFOXYC2_FULL_50_21]OGK01144.1
MKYTILLCAVLVAVSGIWATVAQVVFKENATAKSREILLCDIADVSSDDAHAKAILDSVRIGTVSIPGCRQRLNAERIRRYFLDGLANQDIHVVTSGAEVVLVRASAHELTGVSLQESVRTWVLSKIPWKKDKVHLSFSSIPEKVVLPDNAYELQFKENAQCDWKGAEKLDIIVLSNGAEIKRIPVNIRLQVYGLVCIADRKIARNTVIFSSDLRVEERDLTEIRDNTFANPSLVAGKRATRTIVPGKVINDKMIEEQPVVFKGNKVKILYTVNTASISVDGEAREDGSIGEEIRVRNLVNRKIIKAFVCGEGEVTLTRTGGGES